MKFIDISTDTQATYTLSKNEQCVFFLQNRTGEITIELAGVGAEAHIFAFFVGKAADKQTLHITQTHSTPDTTSSALVKAVLGDDASFIYDGAIMIGKDAHRAKASQESRTLLLSQSAAASTKPTLEILADDVTCRHAATISPLGAEQLFFAASRGLSKTQAEKLLVDGFFQDALETMETLTDNTVLSGLKEIPSVLENYD